MSQKNEISAMAVGDVEDALRRIYGVLNILTYLGDTGSVIDPDSLTYTVCMVRDDLERQIEALCSIRRGVHGDE